MATALQDTRAEDGLEDAISRMEQLQLTGRQAQMRDIAVEEGKEDLAAFKAIVEREDVKEVARDQARSAVTAWRAKSDFSFTAIRSSLETGLAIRRANDDPEVERTAREAETFLDRVQPSEFKAMSTKDALDNFERVSGYLDELVPDELSAPVVAVAEPALDNFRTAVKDETKAHGTWLEAQAALENGRVAIRAAYLSFRDHARGILRKTDQLDKLNQLVPTLDAVLNPGSPSPTPEPAPEPANDDTPEPVPAPDAE